VAGEAIRGLSGIERILDHQLRVELCQRALERPGYEMVTRTWARRIHLLSDSRSAAVGLKADRRYGFQDCSARRDLNVGIPLNGKDVALIPSFSVGRSLPVESDRRKTNADGAPLGQDFELLRSQLYHPHASRP
jgi:hypothetical protein